MNEVRIPESNKIGFKAPNKYSITWSNDDRKKIERLQKLYHKSLQKRENALSSFLKVIIENTYLYLTNSEIGLDNDMLDLLKKSYYSNLDPNFANLLKEDEMVRDFIIELIRIQTLKRFKRHLNLSEKEKNIYEMRLAQDDTDLRKIICGSLPLLSFNEYISSLIQYFLYCSPIVQRKIIYYPKLYMIEKAIKENTCIFINEEKVRPLLVHPYDSILIDDALVFSKCEDDTISQKIFHKLLEDNIEMTCEMFSLSSLEKKAVKLIAETDRFEATFEASNDEKGKEFLTNLERTTLILNKEISEDYKVKLCFKRTLGFAKALKDAEERGEIRNLVFNDNYYEYTKYLKR